MTNDRQLERLLDSWFAEGPTVVPDRAIDGVAARITRQAQRPAWRLQPWRFPTVNTPLKLVLIGAALIAALAAGAVLIGGGPNRGVVVAPTPTPTPVPPNLSDGKLDAGTYTAHPLPGKPMTWTITVPAGWVGDGDWAVHTDAGPGVAAVWVGGPTDNESIPADSCSAIGTPAAKSLDEFIAAVQARDDWAVSAPVDVTLSGYAGKRIDLEVPADVTCGNGSNYMVLAMPSGDGFHAQGPSNQFRLWMIDVEGTPLVLFRSSFANYPAQLVSQADPILETGVITP